MSKTILASALMAAALLGAPFVANADSGHGHKAEKPSKHDDHGESGHHGPAGMQAMNPAAAWAELKEARDAIASDVERGALGDIHEKSEPLPELAAELLEQSGDLEASKRARVQGAIKQVSRVADALHTAADEDDVARTRKELSRLDGILKLIQAQYPAGALDDITHEESGHEDHTEAPGNSHSPHAHM